MITITVIKSAKAECKNCHEAHRVVEEVVAGGYNQDVQIEVLFSNTPEAQVYGIISTPLIAISKKVYSMGKPIIKDNLEKWIRQELGR